MATNQKLPESSNAPPSRNLPCGWSWMSANSETGPMPGGGGGSPQGCPAAGCACCCACADVPQLRPKTPASTRDTTQAICFLLIITVVPSPFHANAMFIKDFLALTAHVGLSPRHRSRTCVLRVELMGGAGKCPADRRRSDRAGNIIHKVIGSAP